MYLPAGIRYGIYFGLMMVFFTKMMWLTGLDTTHIAIGYYFETAEFIFPLIFVFAAIRAKSKQSKLTIINRIFTGLIVTFVSFLIHTPFLYIYHHFINPDWLKYKLEFNEQVLRSHNVPAEKIKEILESINDYNMIFGGLIVGVFVMGIIFSLLTIPFIRSKIQNLN
jgi:hypothetical protein